MKYPVQLIVNGETIDIYDLENEEIDGYKLRSK